MNRVIEMIEQAEGPIKEPTPFESWLADAFSDVGTVENVVYDDVLLNITFNVVGEGWKATVKVDEGKNGSVVVHDTESESNDTLAAVSFNDAEDTSDALAMAYAFILAEPEEEETEED